MSHLVTLNDIIKSHLIQGDLIMDKRCIVCDKQYFAKRADSKFCSAACRKRASRDINDDPTTPATVKKSAKGLGRPPETLLERSKFNPDGSPNEWFESAKHKTQAEIEAHYTLENFPPIKYYSSGGGGTGALMPSYR